MATIDIHDLSGKKVGTFDLADEIFGAVNEDLIWEAVKHYRAGQHRGHQGSLAGFRIGQETVEAEGYGTGAYWLDPVAAVAPRRHGTRSGATFL
jgi:hypothetical protein